MKFDSYHPAINLIFFVLVIVAAINFNQPVFLVISYICPFVYSVKLNGKRGLLFNLILIPLIFLFALFYSYYNHFGITNLAINIIGNQITLEAVTVGFVIGITIASIMMWFSCVHAVVSSDKVIYLFGRIAPKLSLFLSIMLRMVPRIKERGKKIHTAQKCIGRGVGQGNLFRRIHAFFRLVSIVITWTMENFVETSNSMKNRGYALKGRTAFSIYRFDYRDRSFVMIIFVCEMVLLMGVLLGQTQILYNPEIILNRITPLSYVFFVVYAILCLLPMILQIISERQFEKRKMYIPVHPSAI